MAQSVFSLIQRNKRTSLLIAVWLTAFCASLIAIKGAFLSDEYEFIYAAAGIHSFSDFWSVMSSKIGGDFFRPILYLSFILDYWIYGLSAWGYHLTNSILYATTALFISLATWQSGMLYSAQRSDENDQQRIVPKNLLFISVVTGILFGLLPNHHETVTWLAGRTDLLATLWYIAAIYCYLRYLTASNAQTNFKARKRSISLLLLFFALSALAYATKEVSVTLIIVQAAITLWYLYHVRRSIDRRKLSRMLALFALSVMIFLAYILLRHQVIGYWFGGYVTAGQSVFLNITLDSLKKWLLSPLLFAVYSINYAYAFALIQRFTRLPAAVSDYTTFVFYIQYCIYAALGFVIVSTVWLTKKRKVARLTVGVLSSAAIFFYITTIPVVGVLSTLGRTLESTRFLYLPSIGLALLGAYWLSLWKGRLRIIVTGVCILFMCALFMFNYRPWSLASRSASSIREAIEANSSTIHDQDWLYVINVPDNIYGAYVFRRGLPHMSSLVLKGGFDLSHSIITGRGISGTHTHACINTQSEGYHVMQLDEQSGLVQSFQFMQKGEAPHTAFQLGHDSMELNDITEQSDGGYQVTGTNPYITFTGVDLDPKQITDIKLSVVPSHPNLWKQWDVYWTTKSKPTYHMFHRHFWILQDTKPEAGSGISIPACEYPAFVFSDEIQDIRIRFPYGIGEKFALNRG